MARPADARPPVVPATLVQRGPGAERVRRHGRFLRGSAVVLGVVGVATGLPALASLAVGLLDRVADVPNAVYGFATAGGLAHGLVTFALLPVVALLQLLFALAWRSMAGRRHPSRAWVRAGVAGALVSIVAALLVWAFFIFVFSD